MREAMQTVTSTRGRGFTLTVTKKVRGQRDKMSYRKFGLGLVVAAIGMMAFASSAHAVKSVFLINKSSANLHASVTGVQLGEGKLLVAGLNMEVRCPKFTVQEGLILNNDDAHGKLLFEECRPYVHSTGLENKFCHVTATAVDTKLHITATGLILPAELKSGAPAILIESIKALILFLGAECTLPEDNLVTGELCLAIDENDTVKPEVLSSAAIQATCLERPTLGALAQGAGVTDVLKYGIHTASVIGTAQLSLTGAHAGQTLGVSLI